jgi:hypothetical protein
MCDFIFTVVFPAKNRRDEGGLCYDFFISIGRPINLPTIGVPSRMQSFFKPMHKAGGEFGEKNGGGELANRFNIVFMRHF